MNLNPKIVRRSLIGAALLLAGGGAALGADEATTGTNTVCATATATAPAQTIPAHTVAVDGKTVHTIPAVTVKAVTKSAKVCNTVTYNIPTVTVQAPPTGGGTTTTPPDGGGTTTTPPDGGGTTTTPPPPPPPPTGLVDCPLTHDAGADPNTSCWATHTGVLGGTGVTEAQIMANPAAEGFTVHAGDLTITQSNTTVDHEWIQGCVDIAHGANDVTVKDSLITPEGSSCSGANAAGSAIQTDQGDAIGVGTVIEDDTVDGVYKDNPTFGNHDVGITLDKGEVLRVNLFGFGIGYLSNSSTAANPAVFQDDYGHDYYGCAHDDGTWFDSSQYVTFNHGWIMTNDPTQQGSDGCSTAALAGGDDGGPNDVQDHVIIEDSYGEGVTGEDTHWGCGATNSAMLDNVLSTDSKDTASGFEQFASDSWTGNTDSNGNQVGRPDSC